MTQPTACRIKILVDALTECQALLEKIIAGVKLLPRGGQAFGFMNRVGTPDLKETVQIRLDMIKAAIAQMDGVELGEECGEALTDQELFVFWDWIRKATQPELHGMWEELIPVQNRLIRKLERLVGGMYDPCNLPPGPERRG